MDISVESIMADLAKRKDELCAEMDSLMFGLEGEEFILLLDTVAKIEEGPARLLLLEAATRLARKVGN